jgi:hypothetical protein
VRDVSGRLFVPGAERVVPYISDRVVQLVQRLAQPLATHLGRQVCRALQGQSDLEQLTDDTVEQVLGQTPLVGRGTAGEVREIIAPPGLVSVTDGGCTSAGQPARACRPG